MKADLHVHSCYSEDGKSTPQEIIESAKALGFGCIAVTDHNEFRIFDEIKDNGEIIIIPAEEVSSKHGHIVALGIDRHIEKGLSIPDTIDLIHEAGGIAIAAHPYRWYTGLGKKNVLKHAHLFDGVEARNARSTPRNNRKAEELAVFVGKFITAGSDAHTPECIGGGFVDLPDDCRTWQDVIQAIKDKKTVPHSISRKPTGSVKFAYKCVTKWARRGFRGI